MLQISFFKKVKDIFPIEIEPMDKVNLENKILTERNNVAYFHCLGPPLRKVHVMKN